MGKRKRISKEVPTVQEISKEIERKRKKNARPRKKSMLQRRYEQLVQEASHADNIIVSATIRREKYKQEMEELAAVLKQQLEQEPTDAE